MEYEPNPYPELFRCRWRSALFTLGYSLLQPSIFSSVSDPEANTIVLLLGPFLLERLKREGIGRHGRARSSVRTEWQPPILNGEEL